MARSRKVVVWYLTNGTSEQNLRPNATVDSTLLKDLQYSSSRPMFYDLREEASGQSLRIKQK